MSARGLPGDPGEELFLNRPHGGADSPTIEPLRVHRYAHSPSHDQRADSAASNRLEGGTGSSVHTFQPPPGGLSSPAPLPYPDDASHAQAPFRAGAKLPYPDLDPRTTPPALPRFSPPPVSSPGNSGIPSYPKPQSQTSGLAERRGNHPKPLPDSPGPDVPDKDGLFQRMPRRTQEEDSPTIPASSSGAGAGGYDYNRQYYPPPSSSSRPTQPAALNIPNQTSINRLASTASVSTTRASRGSPPPPETPIVAPDDGTPGGGIEARYAAAGIAGTGTLTELQARNAAAAQRQQQYQGQNSSTPSQVPPQRRWTPTEDPNQYPHGSPVTYQGQTPIQTTAPHQFPAPNASSPTSTAGGRAPSTLEQDLQGLQVSNDEDFLVNTFLQMLMPPILTPVEIGPKWASTRAFFGSMATESSLVRSAITAFAAFII